MELTSVPLGEEKDLINKTESQLQGLKIVCGVSLELII